MVFPAPWVTNLSFFLEDPAGIQFWERLSQEMTIILYDKHGCGHSERDRREFTIESELFDLETVIDHLGLDKFILFGTSMAAPVAVTYTFRHPEKVTHLILYGAFANGKTVAKEEVKSALIALVKSAWGVGSKALADIFSPGANADQHQSLAKFQREAATPETAAKLLGLAYELDVTKLLSSIQTPALILHREGDKIAGIQHGKYLASEIPNARFRVLKGDIHIPWYGDSTEIIEAILEFIGKEKEKDFDSGEAEISEEAEDVQALPIEEFQISEQATIVFSDIVSSTDLVTKLGDSAARDIFLQHDKIVRNQIRKHGGRELQNLGDGFMLAFESGSAAINCACDIQKEMFRKLSLIKVRMGINTGEVVRREGMHPFGQAVVIASRIVSKAKGGQILISDVTKTLTSGSKFPSTDKGRFKPKGFTESIRLHEVSWKEV